MKHHFVFNKPAIHFILLVGIFTFVFLGAEYLFVNMISLSVTEGKPSLPRTMRWAPAPSAFSCIRPWNAGLEGAIKAR